MNTTLSIIIPIYNAEKYINRCIESILKNTFSDYEILLINDGSRDTSWEILQKYQKNYPERIKIFNQKNQGIAKTRNAGITKARGKYILFIDDDDWINQDYMDTFVSQIKKSESDIIIGGYRRVSKKKTLFEVRLKNCEWSKYMIIAPWAKIYRKSFLLNNEIEFLDNNIGEDVYFNLHAIHATNKISIIPYVGYNWFLNKESVSNTVHKNFKNNLNFSYLLQSCHAILKPLNVLQKPEVEFYFLRLILWYLFFVGKDSSSKDLLKEFKITFLWLEKNFPNFPSNKNISIFLPKGEFFKNRIFISVFMFLYKIKLVKIFLKFYSRR